MVTTEPLLPPAYRLVRLANGAEPFASALGAASTAEDGDFFWADRPDRLDCAIVLHPELPAAKAGILAHVAMVGLGDAIGALAPPEVAVEFGWPDRLMVNGALAGGIRVATAETNGPDAVPDWQVLAITVALFGDRQNLSPGLRPDVTTLYDEGAGHIAPVSLAESVSRHLLAWVHRWHEDGFAPICASWLIRAVGYRQTIDWPMQDGRLTGRFVGLDEEGGLLLADDESQSSAFRTIPLGPPLSHPNWTL